jgi:hypothetical protein
LRSNKAFGARRAVNLTGPSSNFNPETSGDGLTATISNYRYIVDKVN